MEYNVNFRDLAYKAVPNFKRATAFLGYLYALIKPLQDLNSGVSYSSYSASSTYSVGDLARHEGANYVCTTDIGTPEAFTASKWAPLGSVEDFYTVSENIKTFLAFNSQVVYFEKYLNDKYDNGNDRIYLGAGETVLNYLFNDVEGATPFYFYNNWDVNTTYVAGATPDYVYFGGKVYVCVLGHTGQQPPNATYWSEDSDTEYFYQRGGGSADADFTINVPTGLLGSSLAEFEADIEKYRLAGKTYIIQYF